MFLLVCKAYLLFIRTGTYLDRRNFPGLCEWVRRIPVSREPARESAAEAVCRAVDLAAVWYRKQVFCLQRSATMACLLRQYGLAARLVIGAQSLPFRAHAWVEVEGQVVGEKPYMSEIYTVLDRC
jgi:hypothetical protein